jgi:hypothetical protein
MAAKKQVNVEICVSSDSDLFPAAIVKLIDEYLANELNSGAVLTAGPLPLGHLMDAITPLLGARLYGTLTGTFPWSF